MRRKRRCLVMFGAVIAGTGNVWPTPSVGFTATTLLERTFGEIEGTRDSDLYVQNNVWRPGGSTGWHTHPGHTLIVVTEGTVTEYDGSDPDCKPHVYDKDMAFADGGGHHVHIIRNEGKGMARTTAVQIIPTGTVRRIDVTDPGNCRF